MNLHAAGNVDFLPEQPKVLLVDDDEVNLLLTSIALRERGFAVTEAMRGEEAIEKIGVWLPDVIVLDAIMPGLDGFETCRRLRAIPGFESLPVLMLTGLDDDASITRAYEAGATDFFVKSTQWSLLAGRLAYLLRSARTRQELERNKARLARAQDLARMGSFDWKKGGGGPVFSVEGLRVFGLAPDESLPFRSLLRMLAEDRIRHLANFDTLTGLPNRRQLIWRAERALEHGRRLNHQVALLLIDLDRF